MASGADCLDAKATPLRKTTSHGHRYVVVAGTDARGTCMAPSPCWRKWVRGTHLAQTNADPADAVRWVNQWDNLDGSIERGYAGRSIFFDGGHVRADLTRAGEYARLLASVGINGCTINNVNAVSADALAGDDRRGGADRRCLPAVGRADVDVDRLQQPAGGWRVWRLSTLSIRRLLRGGRRRSMRSMQQIPDFAGFVVKADSEGKPGPSQYGRSPAQAANVLARALKPHGGLVLYRGFVYNHHLDWTDMKADRAKAGYDNFSKLDGTFDDNVVIQIKNGPIDFQVREPASPLFAALRKTNQAIELQVTQEYLGQQRHLVYLVPMWKTTLDTDMRAEDRSHSGEGDR